jgi:tetratricopeptide (TPR) repeat protein
MNAEDPTTYELRVPRSAEVFEEICLDLWRIEWDDRNIQRLGVPGQEQGGIDIYSRDPRDLDKHRVIQCKRYWQTKLTTRIVDNIVDEVRGSKLNPISELVIATTTPNNARIQEYVAKIATDNIVNGLFDVHVYSWNSICSLFRLHPEILRLHYPNPFGLPEDGASFTISGILMDDVRQQLSSGRLDEALVLLDAMLQKQPAMDDNMRFRVLTNKGVVLSRMGKKIEAQDSLLRAYALAKTNEVAGTNAAQACLMVGDYVQASEIAKHVVQFSPSSTLAYRVLVLVSPSSVDAQFVLKDAPDGVMQSGDVLFALGAVAMRESSRDNAIEYLEKSLAAYGHDDPMTCAYLTAAMMEKAQNELLEYGEGFADGPVAQTIMHRAEHLLAVAIGNPSELPRELVCDCYRNRCRVRMWLNEIGGAAEDAAYVMKIAPEDPINQKMWATILYLRNDVDGAIKMLRSITNYRDVPDGLDMLARLLFEQKEYQASLDATVQFLELPNKPFILATFAMHLKTQALLKLGRTDDARDYVDSLLSGDSSNPLWIADRCWCLCAAGTNSHEPSLQAQLEQTVKLSTSAISTSIRDQISKVMVSISRWDLSVRIDEVDFSTDTYDTHSKRLLHGYLTLGRFADAMSLCDKFVQADIQQGQVHWYRAQLNLRSGHMIEAESDLKTCLHMEHATSVPEENIEPHLLLAEVQLANGHFTDALESTTTILDPSRMNPVQFDRLIGLLIGLQQYPRALVAAYNRIFDPNHGTQPETYLSFMRCFMTIDRLVPDVLAQSVTVNEDSAVLLELSPGIKVWYVQDSASRPRMGNVVFVLPTDQLWRSMLGKSVGDAVTIKASSGNMDATMPIAQITGRYAIVLDECFTSFASQFPDRNDMERVPLTAPNDATSVSEQFEKHIADAASFGKHVRRILAAQRSGQIPLSQASRLLTRNPVELFQDVAATPGEYVIATNPGTQPRKCENSITSLVVDPLSCLILSGIPSFRNGIPTRWSVVYAHTTMDVLVEASIELGTYVQHGMESLVSLDGKHFTIATVNPAIVQRRLSQVNTAIEWLREHASVEPCGLILQYGEEKYEQATLVLGRAEVESIALAQESCHALLSDELLVRSVAVSEGAISLSSQDVLQWAREENLIAESEYVMGLLILYQENIRAVYFDSNAVVAACESAHWQVQLLPHSFFGILAADNDGNEGPVIAGKLAVQIYMHVQDPSTRNTNWWPMLLDAVAQGRAATQAFQVMLQSMDKELHLVPQAMQELRKMASIWMGTHVAT